MSLDLYQKRCKFVRSLKSLEVMPCCSSVDRRMHRYFDLKPYLSDSFRGSDKHAKSGIERRRHMFVCDETQVHGKAHSEDCSES